MMAMKKGPIGVWFSVALCVLVLGLWLGSMLGSLAAHYWYFHHQQEQGTLTGPEQLRVESELAELSAVQTLRLYASLPPQTGKPRDKNLLNAIQGLENLRRHSKTPEIKSVIDLELGLANVHAAMAERENNNEEMAKKYMQSAQVLFKSLGWQDYSEETLKVVAKQEFVNWRLLQTKANEK
jgi:hypothetical protein